jgi:L-rhamnose isomerase
MDSFKKTDEAKIKDRFDKAVDFYSKYNVNVNSVLEMMDKKDLSLHCWQGDDVLGFESSLTGANGGIFAVGSQPGRARNANELRADIDMAFSLIPGSRRLNLHAFYLESFGKEVDRDEISPEHFEGWLKWAEETGTMLDFNPTLFSHAKSADSFTITNSDDSIRNFWIEHIRRCRKIASLFSERLGGESVVNLWIPDGMRDMPADRWAPRKRLTESLDEVFKEEYPSIKDSLESKLFGIGSEEYVAGSADYYLSYAVSRKKMVCMDMGHYHPTEKISDKISALLIFLPEILIHLSRPVRWDSDHVVITNDELLEIFRETARGDAFDKVHLATDFFDAGINRIGAWVIGARSVKKAMLSALLEPSDMLKEYEHKGLGAEKLALMEESKWFPVSDVWNFYCMKSDVPPGFEWIKEIQSYQSRILSKR